MLCKWKNKKTKKNPLHVGAYFMLKSEQELFPFV